MIKYTLLAISFIFGVLFLSSCTKTESDFTTSTAETITINASTLNAAVGAVVNFTVTSSNNNTNVTSQSKLYINGILITGNSYTFSTEGTYLVYAEIGSKNSNIITINVKQLISGTGFVSNVLVEEYSGTWCGNCPRILFAVELLHKQTDKAIVVSTHLFNGDPYITTQGNDLAASQRVSGVPTGNINRTISWTGPQDENVNQVVNQIKASSNAGVAISSTLNGGNLLASIKVGYTQALSGNAKLTVYLVEDKLYNSQRNYSSNLYAGQSTIPNFEFNGVMRAVLSSLTGDDIGNAGSLNEKKYSLTIPSNISNINNARLVAFITNASGTVVNVQSAKVGEIKDFERL